MTTRTTKWLALVCVARAGFLDHPEEYLREPETCPATAWLRGVVVAEDEDEAFEKAWSLFDRLELEGTKLGDSLVNWYVRELPYDFAIRSADPNQMDMLAGVEA